MFNEERRISRTIFGILMAVIMVLVTVTLPVFNTLSFGAETDEEITSPSSISSQDDPIETPTEEAVTAPSIIKPTKPRPTPRANAATVIDLSAADTNYTGTGYYYDAAADTYYLGNCDVTISGSTDYKKIVVTGTAVLTKIANQDVIMSKVAAASGINYIPIQIENTGNLTIRFAPGTGNFIIASDPTLLADTNGVYQNVNPGINMLGAAKFTLDNPETASGKLMITAAAVGIGKCYSANISGAAGFGYNANSLITIKGHSKLSIKATSKYSAGIGANGEGTNNAARIVYAPSILITDNAIVDIYTSRDFYAISPGIGSSNCGDMQMITIGGFSQVTTTTSPDSGHSQPGIGGGVNANSNDATKTQLFFMGSCKVETKTYADQQVDGTLYISIGTDSSSHLMPITIDLNEDGIITCTGIGYLSTHYETNPSANSKMRFIKGTIFQVKYSEYQRAQHSNLNPGRVILFGNLTYNQNKTFTSYEGVYILPNANISLGGMFIKEAGDSAAQGSEYDVAYDQINVGTNAKILCNKGGGIQFTPLSASTTTQIVNNGMITAGKGSTFLIPPDPYRVAPNKISSAAVDSFKKKQAVDLGGGMSKVKVEMALAANTTQLIKVRCVPVTPGDFPETPWLTYEYGGVDIQPIPYNREYYIMAYPVANNAFDGFDESQALQLGPFINRQATGADGDVINLKWREDEIPDVGTNWYYDSLEEEFHITGNVRVIDANDTRSDYGNQPLIVNEGVESTINMDLVRLIRQTSTYPALSINDNSKVTVNLNSDTTIKGRIFLTTSSILTISSIGNKKLNLTGKIVHPDTNGEKVKMGELNIETTEVEFNNDGFVPYGYIGADWNTAASTVNFYGNNTYIRFLNCPVYGGNPVYTNVSWSALGISGQKVTGGAMIGGVNLDYDEVNVYGTRILYGGFNGGFTSGDHKNFLSDSNQIIGCLPDFLSSSKINLYSGYVGVRNIPNDGYVYTNDGDRPSGIGFGSEFNMSAGQVMICMFFWKSGAKAVISGGSISQYNNSYIEYANNLNAISYNQNNQKTYKAHIVFKDTLQTQAFNNSYDSNTNALSIQSLRISHVRVYNYTGIMIGGTPNNRGALDLYLPSPEGLGIARTSMDTIQICVTLAPHAYAQYPGALWALQTNTFRTAITSDDTANNLTRDLPTFPIIDLSITNPAFEATNWTFSDSVYNIGTTRVTVIGDNRDFTNYASRRLKVNNGATTYITLVSITLRLETGNAGIYIGDSANVVLFADNTVADNRLYVDSTRADQYEKIITCCPNSNVVFEGTGTNSLRTTSGYHQGGIGSRTAGAGGNIFFNSGNIIAQHFNNGGNNSYVAEIGGTSNLNMYFNGANVTAAAGDHNGGIGASGAIRNVNVYFNAGIIRASVASNSHGATNREHAAIGSVLTGGTAENSGLFFNGGDITATGNVYDSAIRLGWGNNTSKNIIRFSGGKVKANVSATNSEKVPCIGGSLGPLDIEFLGGTVTTTTNHAGIGYSNIWSAAALSTSSSVKITISGGSINTANMSNQPTNGLGQNVYENVFQIISDGGYKEKQIGALDVPSAPYYGVHDVFTDTVSKIYVYLPTASGVETVVANINGLETGGVYFVENNAHSHPDNVGGPTILATVTMTTDPMIDMANLFPPDRCEIGGTVYWEYDKVNKVYIVYADEITVTGINTFDKLKRVRMENMVPSDSTRVGVINLYKDVTIDASEANEQMNAIEFIDYGSAQINLVEPNNGGQAPTYNLKGAKNGSGICISYNMNDCDFKIVNQVPLTYGSVKLNAIGQGDGCGIGVGDTLSLPRKMSITITTPGIDLFAQSIDLYGTHRGGAGIGTEDQGVFHKIVLENISITAIGSGAGSGIGFGGRTPIEYLSNTISIENVSGKIYGGAFGGSGIGAGATSTVDVITDVNDYLKRAVPIHISITSSALDIFVGQRRAGIVLSDPSRYTEGVGIGVTNIRLDLGGSIKINLKEDIINIHNYAFSSLIGTNTDSGALNPNPSESYIEIDGGTIKNDLRETLKQIHCGNSSQVRILGGSVYSFDPISSVVVDAAGTPLSARIYTLPNTSNYQNGNKLVQEADLGEYAGNYNITNTYVSEDAKLYFYVDPSIHTNDTKVTINAIAYKTFTEGVSNYKLFPTNQEYTITQNGDATHETTWLIIGFPIPDFTVGNTNNSTEWARFIQEQLQLRIINNSAVVVTSGAVEPHINLGESGFFIIPIRVINVTPGGSGSGTIDHVFDPYDGFTFSSSSNTVTVYKQRTEVINAVANGQENKTDTSKIRISFNRATDNLTSGAISFTDGTGAVVKGTLTKINSVDYDINVSTTSQGSVNLILTNYITNTTSAIIATTIAIKVFTLKRTGITFTAVQVGGVTNSVDSEYVRITFNSFITVGSFVVNSTNMNGKLFNFYSPIEQPNVINGTVFDVPVDVEREGDVSITIILSNNFKFGTNSVVSSSSVRVFKNLAYVDELTYSVTQKDLDYVLNIPIQNIGLNFSWTDFRNSDQQFLIIKFNSSEQFDLPLNSSTLNINATAKARLVLYDNWTSVFGSSYVPVAGFITSQAIVVNNYDRFPLYIVPIKAILKNGPINFEISSSWISSLVGPAVVDLYREKTNVIDISNFDNVQDGIGWEYSATTSRVEITENVIFIGTENKYRTFYDVSASVNTITFAGATWRGGWKDATNTYHDYFTINGSDITIHAVGYNQLPFNFRHRSYTGTVDFVGDGTLDFYENATHSETGLNGVFQIWADKINFVSGKYYIPRNAQPSNKPAAEIRSDIIANTINVYRAVVVGVQAQTTIYESLNVYGGVFATNIITMGPNVNIQGGSVNLSATVITLNGATDGTPVTDIVDHRGANGEETITAGAYGLEGTELVNGGKFYRSKYFDSGTFNNERFILKAGNTAYAKTYKQNSGLNAITYEKVTDASFTLAEYADGSTYTNYIKIIFNKDVDALRAMDVSLINGTGYAEPNISGSEYEFLTKFDSKTFLYPIKNALDGTINIKVDTFDRFEVYQNVSLNMTGGKDYNSWTIEPRNGDVATYIPTTEYRLTFSVPVPYNLSLITFAYKLKDESEKTVTFDSAEQFMKISDTEYIISVKPNINETDDFLPVGGLMYTDSYTPMLTSSDTRVRLVDIEFSPLSNLTSGFPYMESQTVSGIVPARQVNVLDIYQQGGIQDITRTTSIAVEFDKPIYNLKKEYIYFNKNESQELNGRAVITYVTMVYPTLWSIELSQDAEELIEGDISVWINTYAHTFDFYDVGGSGEMQVFTRPQSGIGILSSDNICFARGNSNPLTIYNPYNHTQTIPLNEFYVTVDGITGSATSTELTIPYLTTAYATYYDSANANPAAPDPNQSLVNTAMKSAIPLGWTEDEFKERIIIKSGFGSAEIESLEILTTVDYISNVANPDDTQVTPDNHLLYIQTASSLIIRLKDVIQGDIKIDILDTEDVVFTGTFTFATIDTSTGTSRMPISVDVVSTNYQLVYENLGSTRSITYTLAQIGGVTGEGIKTTAIAITFSAVVTDEWMDYLSIPDSRATYVFNKSQIKTKQPGKAYLIPITMTSITRYTTEQSINVVVNNYKIYQFPNKNTTTVKVYFEYGVGTTINLSDNLQYGFWDKGTYIGTSLCAWYVNKTHSDRIFVITSRAITFTGEARNITLVNREDPTRVSDRNGNFILSSCSITNDDLTYLMQGTGNNFSSSLIFSMNGYPTTITLVGHNTLSAIGAKNSAPISISPNSALTIKEDIATYGQPGFLTAYRSTSDPSTDISIGFSSFEATNANTQTGSITINSGYVYANKGIGGRYASNAGDRRTIINGGTVKIDSEGILGHKNYPLEINGGSVDFNKANLMGTGIKNALNQDVFKLTAQINPGGLRNVFMTSQAVSWDSNYQSSNIYTDYYGKMYLWVVHSANISRTITVAGLSNKYVNYVRMFANDNNVTMLNTIANINQLTMAVGQVGGYQSLTITTAIALTFNYNVQAKLSREAINILTADAIVSFSAAKYLIFDKVNKGKVYIPVDIFAAGTLRVIVSDDGIYDLYQLTTANANKTVAVNYCMRTTFTAVQFQAGGLTQSTSHIDLTLTPNPQFATGTAVPPLSAFTIEDIDNDSNLTGRAQLAGDPEVLSPNTLRIPIIEVEEGTIRIQINDFTLPNASPTRGIAFMDGRTAEVTVKEGIGRNDLIDLSLVNYDKVARDNNGDIIWRFDLKSGLYTVYKNVTVINSNLDTGYRVAVASGYTVTIKMRDVAMINVEPGEASVSIQEDAKAHIITEGTNSNTIIGGFYSAGIEVNKNASLTMTALTSNLSVIGGDYAAGIGSSYNKELGKKIEITDGDGTITVFGGVMSAAIGGAYKTKYAKGTTFDFISYAGKIKAYGGLSSSAIGTGAQNEIIGSGATPVFTTFILSGTVVAKAGVGNNISDLGNSIGDPNIKFYNWLGDQYKDGAGNYAFGRYLTPAIELSSYETINPYPVKKYKQSLNGGNGPSYRDTFIRLQTVTDSSLYNQKIDYTGYFGRHDTGSIGQIVAGQAWQMLFDNVYTNDNGEVYLFLETDGVVQYHNLKFQYKINGIDYMGIVDFTLYGDSDPERTTAIMYEKLTFTATAKASSYETTSIAIHLSRPAQLRLDDINIINGTGFATKDSLVRDNALDYTLILKEAITPGAIQIEIPDVVDGRYKVDPNYNKVNVTLVARPKMDFEITQLGGQLQTRPTTGMTITFTENIVTNVTVANQIYDALRILPGDVYGIAVKTGLTEWNGNSITFTVKTNEEGEVYIDLSALAYRFTYRFAQTKKLTEVYLRESASWAVTAQDGETGKTDTTQLKIEFSIDVALGIPDITLEGVENATAKAVGLIGTSTEYFLEITNVNEGYLIIHLNLADSPLAVSATRVKIFSKVNATMSAISNGTESVSPTDTITLTFSTAVALVASDIEFIEDIGLAELDTSVVDYFMPLDLYYDSYHMCDVATKYELKVITSRQGDIKLKINISNNYFKVVPETNTVAAYTLRIIDWTATQIGGVAYPSAQTTAIDIAFDARIDNLTLSKIEITNSTGAVVVSSLSQVEFSKWRIALSDVIGGYIEIKVNSFDAYTITNKAVSLNVFEEFGGRDIWLGNGNPVKNGDHWTFNKATSTYALSDGFNGKITGSSVNTNVLIRVNGNATIELDNVTLSTKGKDERPTENETFIVFGNTTINLVGDNTLYGYNNSSIIVAASNTTLTIGQKQGYTGTLNLLPHPECKQGGGISGQNGSLTTFNKATYNLVGSGAALGIGWGNNDIIGARRHYTPRIVINDGDYMIKTNTNVVGEGVAIGAWGGTFDVKIYKGHLDIQGAMSSTAIGFVSGYSGTGQGAGLTIYDGTIDVSKTHAGDASKNNIGGHNSFKTKILGGSVNATIDPKPVNNTQTELSPVDIQVGAEFPSAGLTSVKNKQVVANDFEFASYYQLQDAYTDSTGKVYLWFPPINNTETIQIKAENIWYENKVNPDNDNDIILKLKTTFTVAQVGGIDGQKDSEFIEIKFDKDVVNLTKSAILISYAGTTFPIDIDSLTKVNGSTYRLAIPELRVIAGIIYVDIEETVGYVIRQDSAEAEVYQEVSYTNELNLGQVPPIRAGEGWWYNIDTKTYHIESGKNVTITGTNKDTKRTVSVSAPAVINLKGVDLLSEDKPSIEVVGGGEVLFNIIGVNQINSINSAGIQINTGVAIATFCGSNSNALVYMNGKNSITSFADELVFNYGNYEIESWYESVGILCKNLIVNRAVINTTEIESQGLMVIQEGSEITLSSKLGMVALKANQMIINGGELNVNGSMNSSESPVRVAGTITVNDGTIKVVTGLMSNDVDIMAGSVYILGGSVDADKIYPTPINLDEKGLYENVLQIGTQVIQNKLITGFTVSDYMYNSKHIKTDKNGKIHVWLPRTTYTAVISAEYNRNTFVDKYNRPSAMAISKVLKPQITFTAVQVGGSMDSADTTSIMLTLSKPIDNLSLKNVGIDKGTADFTVKEMTKKSPTSYSISITTTKQGGAKLALSGLADYNAFETITVNVYTKKEITFTAKADGKSKKTTSKVITLTFSSDITGLTIKNIKVAKGTGNATISKITGKGKVWKITIKKVTKEGKVKLTIPSFGTYNVKTGTLQVGVYKKK